jgi:hypothetical protein
VAIPAGFHQLAVASSATATNAPPMPWARVPTSSKVCALAGRADTTASPAARKAGNHAKFRIFVFIGKRSRLEYRVARVRGRKPRRGRDVRGLQPSLVYPTRTAAATTWSALSCPQPPFVTF